MRPNTHPTIIQKNPKSRALPAQRRRFPRPFGLDENVVAFVVADGGDCARSGATLTSCQLICTVIIVSWEEKDIIIQTKLPRIEIEVPRRDDKFPDFVRHHRLPPELCSCQRLRAGNAFVWTAVVGFRRWAGFDGAVSWLGWVAEMPWGTAPGVVFWKGDGGCVCWVSEAGGARG